MQTIKLRLTGSQYQHLKSHLYPGDGKESVAVALCGRRSGSQTHCLMVHKLVSIPYEECKNRTRDSVTWSTARLVPLLQEASKRDMAIVKFHSHPQGLNAFSAVDDAADKDLFNSVFGWTDSQYPHASAIMLPDGSLFGRAAIPDGSFRDIDLIAVASDNLTYWPAASNNKHTNAAGFLQRHKQLFGAGTTKKLRNLSVAVVGCSGTGSPTIEQLARLGVGRLTLVDPDHIEERNLNRILNASMEDAYLRRKKVEVMARAIARMGLATELTLIPGSLGSRTAVEAVAQCDVLFGCMDSVEGRHMLNRLAAYYSIPYFDIGVGLVSDGHGGINEVCGAVHYLRPDGATLFDRKVYTLDQLKAEGLLRTDPEAYRLQVKAGYIKGVREDRPAVISINMQLSSMAVNEFLARLHPYRHDDNSEFAIVRTSFIQGATYNQQEGPSSGMFTRYIGRGDSDPPLGMPELSGQT